MPNEYNWQLQLPVDTFIFDCDATLSLIEGIDWLASQNGVSEQVHAITHRCMASTGLRVQDYRERLDRVLPVQSQLHDLALEYLHHVARGAMDVIRVLQDLGKKIYIISAGIRAAVAEFALELGVPANQVFAVDVFFDNNGNYKGFDEHSLLVTPHGKLKLLETLLQPGERSLLVGDGISDWEASQGVTRFTGFAGINPKKKVQEQAEFYIASSSLYPVLPLGLTLAEGAIAGSAYLTGLAEIKQGMVLFKEKQHDAHSGI